MVLPVAFKWRVIRNQHQELLILEHTMMNRKVHTMRMERYPKICRYLEI